MVNHFISNILQENLSPVAIPNIGIQKNVQMKSGITYGLVFANFIKESFTSAVHIIFQVCGFVTFLAEIIVLLAFYGSSGYYPRFGSNDLLT